MSLLKLGSTWSKMTGGSPATISNSPNNKAQGGGKGKKHRTHKRVTHKCKTKKGGNIGSIISQALVPGALLAVQNTFGKRTRRHRRHHRKHKKHSRRH
mgnify:CR=1 FL=1